ncbi:MAG: creatininase family protein [Bacteroidales bacterium]|nr:creatininase family protein [Bacteroidales bacterium]
MHPYVLEENNWKDVSGRVYRLALLPWGSTEAHNFHLPYGTDTFLAKYVAEEAAKYAWERNVQSVVLPALAYGVNLGQMEVPLCMNMHPSTQKVVLDNIVEVLVSAGITRLIVVNGHGGNQFQPIIRELSVKYPHMLMATINWWSAVNGAAYFDDPGDHAGALETSAMQAVRPDWVLPLELAGDGAERLLKAQGFRERWAWTPRRWILVTQDTGVGNPFGAKAEQGEKFLRDCMDKIGDFVIEFARADKEEDLYE